VLRRIFVPKKEEIILGWRKLLLLLFSTHNHNNQVKEDEVGWACSSVRIECECV
jgi:hypothetical protein